MSAAGTSLRIWAAVTGKSVAGARALFATVFVIVFLSRLPFLDAGYGSINDAWRVANAAREISVTGRYTASRLPPHPVQELACSLFWRGGPFLSNGATALLSALAVSFFALSMRRLGIGGVLEASAALAFAPIVFMNSCNSTDYLWALSFILGGLFFVLDGKPIVAGIFLGLAIGSRITSGAMLLPLSVLLAQRESAGKRLTGVAKLALAACGVGAAAFVPVFRNYGSHFLTFTEGSHPSTLEILRKATIELWGIPGTAAMVFVLAWQLARRARRLDPARGLDSERRREAFVWIVCVALYAIAFLRLPHLAAYLIPAVPFVLLFLASVLHRPAFRVVCAAIAFSSFVTIGRAGLSPGPIFQDRTARLEGMVYVRKVVDLGRRLRNPSVIVSGHWFPKIAVYVPGAREGSVEYVWLLDANDLRSYRARGFEIYFLPGQREYNSRHYGVDPVAYGSQPLVRNPAGWHW